MPLTKLQKRIEEAFKAYTSSCPADYVIVDEKKTFEAGFLWGIEDTVKRTVQSNDDVISEIDAIVGRTFARMQAEKASKTSNQT